MWAYVRKEGELLPVRRLWRVITSRQAKNENNASSPSRTYDGLHLLFKSEYFNFIDIFALHLFIFVFVLSFTECNQLFARKFNSILGNKRLG